MARDPTNFESKLRRMVKDESLLGDAMKKALLYYREQQVVIGGLGMGMGGEGGKRVGKVKEGDGGETKGGASSASTDRTPTGEKRELCDGSIWNTPLPKAKQLEALRAIVELCCTFGTVWQVVEEPSRAFDSERSLVAGAQLALFDAILRVSASDDPLLLSGMLQREGGYYLSTTVCAHNMSYRELTHRMELWVPGLARTRCAILHYFETMEERCEYVLEYSDDTPR